MHNEIKFTSEYIKYFLKAKLLQMYINSFLLTLINEDFNYNNI